MTPAPRWLVLNLAFIVFAAVLFVASLFPWIDVLTWEPRPAVYYRGSPWGGVMVAIVAALLATSALVFRQPLLSCAVLFAGIVGGLFAAADYVRAELSGPYAGPTVWLQLACVACAALAVGGLGAVIEYRRLTRRGG